MRRKRQSMYMTATRSAVSTTFSTALSRSKLAVKGAPPSIDDERRRYSAPLILCTCVGRSLGEVVADVAEDVLDLAPQEDHRDDDGDGDDCDDEGILNEALAFVFA